MLVEKVRVVDQNVVLQSCRALKVWDLSPVSVRIVVAFWGCRGWPLRYSQKLELNSSVSMDNRQPNEAAEACFAPNDFTGFSLHFSLFFLQILFLSNLDWYNRCIEMVFIVVALFSFYSIKCTSMCYDYKWAILNSILINVNTCLLISRKIHIYIPTHFHIMTNKSKFPSNTFIFVLQKSGT